ncbi:hypothetical protein L7F22_063462 [Adiantum nelumboides]|nr:hypothetical protein [Adiantum nelumboides]
MDPWTNLLLCDNGQSRPQLTSSPGYPRRTASHERDDHDPTDKRRQGYSSRCQPLSWLMPLSFRRPSERQHPCPTRGCKPQAIAPPHIMFRYLHCGDFRASPRHIEHPAIKGKRIDIVYLDTTYLNPRYCFPAQEQVVNACAQAVREAAPGQTDACRWQGGAHDHDEEDWRVSPLKGKKLRRPCR